LVMRLLSESCFDGFRATSPSTNHFGRGNLLAARHSTGKFLFMPNPAKTCDAEIESVDMELTPDERGVHS
jgi:hypothetical protein